MRHMILSLPKLTHIFPFTIKVMPLNIFFSSTSDTGASASLTRLANFSLYAIKKKLLILKVIDSILPGGPGLNHFCFPFPTANVQPRKNEEAYPVEPFAHPSIRDSKEEFFKDKINVHAIHS